VIARHSILAAALIAALASAAEVGLAQDAAKKTADKTATPQGDEKGEEKGKDKSDKWDVNAPPGEAVAVPIDTDEGTWLSVDVSPDGNEIVFDLLGDIYTVGVSGQARALTSGMAWDMQPRFSPDGTRIAFTSDRGGGDNIWVMSRDGSEPRAVTKETFRLLNSPVWTPDGEYIAARKHFTARRSLGAGEIWLYHHTGGSGLQLVKRLNDQKDLGEPAFSPDGRYLYYSLDATPGSTFEYNKDSNAGIYQIRRLDRETGETETIVSGPGGAIRPTPSPDGKSLAFVRRVRFRTTLWIHDLESGEERVLDDDLERDMQETWAVHGVYPSMAWTRDGQSIVFWARGKIRSIDVATRKVREIPFRVRDTREIRQAVRFPVEVCPPEFDVRMLRWVQVSPRGDRVLFQALGHVWLRGLPDEKPRRLTEQSEHFEVYPSFSPDGESVVFATWDDEELGTVRIRNIESGEECTLATGKGHFAEPEMAPDGKTVVYRRIGGGYLRSPLWSKERGLYRVGVDGGDPEILVRGSASAPHFAAGSERVFFSSRSGGKRTLESIGLDGKERRTHLRSDNATEFRVSPDARWVTFRERFHVFVLPFLRTGGAIDVGPGTRSIPFAKASDAAGEYLHWSGDSKRLHWTLGPELFTRELTDVFAFLDGSSENESDKAATAPEVLPIGFRHPSDMPGGQVAFVGARIVTMKGDEIIEDGTLVVDRNRIIHIGPRKSVTWSEKAHVVDARGLTILPGLVDAHAHGAQGTSEIVPEQNWISFSQLAFGVTTIHDPSNDTSTIFAASEMARAGVTTAPRIFSTGTILYGAAGDFKAEVDSLEDARFHIRRMHAVGAFSVKSYNQPRRDQRQQVLTAAREQGVMVCPEGGSLFQHNMTMVIDGHTTVEHCLPVANVYDDVVDLWSHTKTGYTPTLGVAYGGLSGEYYWYQHTDVWANERLLAFVPRPIIDARSRRPTKAPEVEYNHISAARGCKKLSDAGVEVNLGAHGQREGLAAHWELWMLVQGGMTPHEALRAGTINGARTLGLDRDIGSLEVGKLADLIVLEKNPLANIRHSEHIRYTMVNGRLLDARTLAELGHRPRQRAPFYWQRGAGQPTADGHSRHACDCGAGRHRH